MWDTYTNAHLPPCGVATTHIVLQHFQHPDPICDLGMPLHACDATFAPTHPPKIVPLLRFDKYLEERQYELFMVGADLRRAESREMRCHHGKS